MVRSAIRFFNFKVKNVEILLIEFLRPKITSQLDLFIKNYKHLIIEK